MESEEDKKSRGLRAKGNCSIAGFVIRRFGFVIRPFSFGIGPESFVIPLNMAAE